jgi:hypothetical protein
VRRFGGVLEHPQASQLWRACRLPRPGELPDEYGGRSYEVMQVAWGHACKKPTWLYVVGVDSELVMRGIKTGGEPTHRITRGPRGPQLARASAKVGRLSPPAFAQWLVDLARASRTQRLATARETHAAL